MSNLHRWSQIITVAGKAKTLPPSPRSSAGLQNQSHSLLHIALISATFRPASCSLLLSCSHDSLTQQLPIHRTNPQQHSTLLLTGSTGTFLFAIAAFAEESKAALTVPAVPEAPAATAAVSRAAVASAEAAPVATLAPTPIPTVPKPVTVINVQASNDTSSNETALYSVLRVIGTGVTPFNLDSQTILLTALGYVISTVDLDNMYITDVNPVYASRRRQLLMEASNQEVTFCMLLPLPSSQALSTFLPLSLPSSCTLPAAARTQTCNPCTFSPFLPRSRRPLYLPLPVQAKGSSHRS